MNKLYAPISKAQLDWNPEGEPISREYGDVYFSSAGGLAESRHVFLEGNDLPQRLACAMRFTIGETGFGSGLNFLALWRLWEATAPADARLHFFSAEKHPLSSEDMARIHALFPEVSRYAEELRINLPLPLPGFHRLVLADGRVTLTLMYGDALDMFREQQAQADAWFLDGFAPRLNPCLWSIELAQELRRLSATGATIATFSTSQTTIDVLTAAGFSVRKRPGFGRKRHMLRGAIRGGEWKPVTTSGPVAVQVIGAGLAGASVAYALARRGCKVSIYDKAGKTAGASTNPCAVFYPGVASGWQPETSFYYMGYSYTRRLLEKVAAAHPVAHAFCGMLLFPKPSDSLHRLARVTTAMKPEPEVFCRVDIPQATALAGIDIKHEALYFPGGGWVSIHEYTRALLTHTNISFLPALPPVDGHIPVILSHGGQASDWWPEAADYIHLVLGQITLLRVERGSLLDGLRCVLSYGGYIAPTGVGSCHLGATYERDVDYESADWQKGAQANLDKLSRFLGECIKDEPVVPGWIGLRSVSRDRMPMVGHLRENIYLSMAHASRGLLSCGISGEYVASLLFGEPLPLPGSILKMLDPNRFLPHS